MSRNQRLSFLGVAAVIVVIAIVVFAASGGPDETAEDAASPAAGQTSTPTSSGTPASGDRSTATPTATAKPQAPLLESGKVAKLRYTEGDTVTFRVVSDKAEEVHVHGYDIKKELEAGKPATMSFKASITGIFEIEFEGSAEQIAELRVDPE